MRSRQTELERPPLQCAKGADQKSPLVHWSHNRHYLGLLSGSLITCMGLFNSLVCGLPLSRVVAALVDFTLVDW